MRVAYGREEQAALADDTDCNAVLLHLPAWRTALPWLQSLSPKSTSRKQDMSAGQQLSASDASDKVPDFSSMPPLHMSCGPVSIKRWDAISIAMPLGAHSSQNYPVQHEATGSTLQLQCRTAQGKLQGSAGLPIRQRCRLQQAATQPL